MYQNVRPCETLTRVFTFSASVTTTTSRILDSDSEWLVQRAVIKSINLEELRVYCSIRFVYPKFDTPEHIRKMLVTWLEDSVSDVR